MSTRQFLFLLFLAQLLTHLPFLDLPPLGQHTWRQVDAASQARNYFEEQAPFFSPRSDLRLDPDDQGAIYKELPVLYWLVGQSYKLTGFSDINLRAVQLIVSLGVIFAAFRFGLALQLSPIQARWFTFFFTTAPYCYYYSITMLPDLTALGCFLFGLSLVLPCIQARKVRFSYLWGSLFLSLAVLFKATWLLFGLPFSFWYIRAFAKGPRRELALMALGTATLMLGLFYLQYRHQIALYQAAPLERAQETYLSTKEFPQTWERVLAILKQSIGTWFFGFYINFASLPFWLVGAYMALKRIKSPSTIGFFWLLWFLSFVIYGSLFFISFGPDGGYYLTPILPLAVYFTTLGVTKMMNSAKYRSLSIGLVCLVPLVMVFRVQARWTQNVQVPEELLFQSRQIIKLLPDQKRVLVIGDKGVIIFLYYLHAKGISYPRQISLTAFKRYREKGFRSLVFFAPMGNIDQVRSQLTLKGEVGRFFIYQINPRKPQGRRRASLIDRAP